MSTQFGAPTEQRKGLPVWAWLLIVPCGCLVLLVPVCAILAAILFPVFSQAREKARAISCLSNVKQMSLASRMYSQDYDEVYPPATTWMDSTRPYYGIERVLHCPTAAADEPAAYGYAYNSKLSRIPAARITSPNKTVLLYD